MPPSGPTRTVDARTVDARTVDAWGRVIVSADDLIDLFYNDADPAQLQVGADARIDLYNHWCAAFNKTEAMIPPLQPPSGTPAEEHARRAQHWLVAEDYRQCDVHAILLPRCPDAAAQARLAMEIELFAAHGLIPVLQLMLALVDYFRREGIVWGVGRGSSCASYALFLIGIHKVDALRYNLDIREFIKP